MSQVPAERSRTPAWVAAGTFAVLPYAELLGGNDVHAVDTALVVAVAGVTLVVCLLPVLAAGRRGPAAMGRTAVWVAYLTWAVTHFSSFPRAHDDDGLLVWGALVVLVAIPLVLLSRRRAVQVFVAVTGCALLVAVGVTSATGLAGSSDGPTAVSSTPFVDDVAIRPNVYFMVLDGYGSADVLLDGFGVDISGFVEFLRDEGFVHHPDAVANYPTTFLSLSSTFDSAYLVEEGGHMGASFQPYFDRVRGLNRTVETFQSLGYRYVHASPGIWEGSTCGGAEDICIGNTGGLSETAWALVQRTPFASATDDVLGQREHVAAHGDPAFVIDRVLETREVSTPTFTFVHVVAPHPPYVRDAQCDVRHDTELQLDTFGNDRTLYADAVRCINDQLRRAVTTLVAADPSAVVILQGDHGPGFGFDWNDANAPLDERMPIFSAWRTPGRCEPTLRSAINTFRVVFSCLAQQPVDELDDVMLWGGFRGRPAVRVNRQDIGMDPVGTDGG